MKKTLLLIISSFAIAGCGSQIQNFVSGASKKPPQAVDPLDSSKALKLSPGHTAAFGTANDAVMTVTPTQRTIKGSHVDAKITLHSSRTQ